MTSTNAAHRFRLLPVPPFRLDLTAWVLRRQPANVLDRWDGTTYRRAVMSSGSVFDLAVGQEGAVDAPVLRVEVRGDDNRPEIEEVAAKAVERLLGTEADLAGFYEFAAGHKELKPLVERFRGVKPPRFPTVFEALANGIIFQQISLASGISMFNRFVENYGTVAPGSALHAFPLPRTIAGVTIEDLRNLGLSRQKTQALIELASAVKDGLNTDQLDSMSDEEALAFLYRLRGVGIWTAQYCLLRGLGRLHVLPGDDVGARNRVMSLMGLDKPPDYEEMQDIIRGWYPYAGIVYFHLLLGHLAEKGYVK